MDVADTRRLNLRRYVDAHFAGNTSAFSRKLNRVPSFFNDLFAGRKSFGEKLARNLESKIGLSSGALDNPTDSVVQVIIAPKAGSTWPFKIARERFDALPHDVKQQAEGALLNIILDYEQSDANRKTKTNKRRAI